MDISKKDWKLFREKLSGWQENYMESLVKEYAKFLNKSSNFSESFAFSEVFKSSAGENLFIEKKLSLLL